MSLPARSPSVKEILLRALEDPEVQEIIKDAIRSSFKKFDQEHNNQEIIVAS